MATEAMVQPDEISQILKQQLLGFEKEVDVYETGTVLYVGCLLYTSPSPRDAHESRMPSSA